jgi:hypothetical protein
MTDERASPDESGAVNGDSEGCRERTGPYIDEVFDVLADWRRREICQFFMDTTTTTASVDDLAMLVAGCRPESVSADRSHESVVIGLQEKHLPKLAAAGVVDFDRRSGTVRYRGQPTVEKWVEHVVAIDERVD